MAKAIIGTCDSFIYTCWKADVRGASYHEYITDTAAFKRHFPSGNTV